MKENGEEIQLRAERENEIKFADIFNLEEIQRMQDLFSDATGVASIITDPEGKSITRPSNACRLCDSIILKTEKGRASCYRSHAALDQPNSSGPIMQHNACGELWDAGTSITVGGKHLACWLIGPVRSREVDSERIAEYAVEIGASSEDLMEALSQVPVMSVEQFAKVSKMLFAFVTELSENAYSNVELKMQIAERDKATESLRQSNELLSQFIKNSPIFAYIKEVTSTTSRVLRASENYQDMIGIKGSEMVGKTMEELFPAEFASKISADDWAVVFGGMALNLDEDLNGRNYTTMKYPIFQEGRNLLAGYTIDITERKRAVEELKIKNEEYSRLLAEKDKFFSIIAHDLRSPFSSFLGLTQIMAEKLPNLTMDEIQKFAVTMRNSATNLFRLLENLLQWSKMQQGLIPFKPEVVPLRSNLEESIAMVRESAKIKEIEIAYNIPVNIAIFADRNIFQTVVRNLVSNAVKFTPRGGKISLSAKATGDKTVEITVKDTGIGMSPEMIDGLFQLETQTNRNGTEGELSTGLGLVLCKEFMERHGGKIWVESEEGKGSVFYFTLPISPDKE